MHTQKTKYIGRGGSKVGAGRPEKSPTHRIRVPVGFGNEDLAKLIAMREILESYQIKSLEKCSREKKMPRFDELNKLLDEVAELMNAKLD